METGEILSGDRIHKLAIHQVSIMGVMQVISRRGSWWMRGGPGRRRTKPVGGRT